VANGSRLGRRISTEPTSKMDEVLWRIENPEWSILPERFICTR
jgi:hypothetical protein